MQSHRHSISNYTQPLRVLSFQKNQIVEPAAIILEPLEDVTMERGCYVVKQHHVLRRVTPDYRTEEKRLFLGRIFLNPTDPLHIQSCRACIFAIAS